MQSLLLFIEKQFLKVEPLVTKFIISVFFIAAFIFPSYTGYTRLENIALPFLILVLITRRLRFDRFHFGLMVAMFIIVLTSVVVNTDGTNGFMESLRWPKLLLFMVFFSSLNRSELSFSRQWIFICFILMLAINLLQITNLNGWGKELAEIYTNRERFSDQVDISRTFRLIGTEANPNNNGILWLVMSTLMMGWYFQAKHLKYLLMVGVCFIIIIFTQSRTIIVSYLLAFLLFMLEWRFSLKNLSIAFGILAMAFLITLTFNFTYIWQMFLYNPFELHSLYLRYQVWEELWRLFQMKPILGWGSLQNVQHLLKKAADNEQLYVLMVYGAAGFLNYLFLLFYPIYKTFKHIRKSIFAMSVLYLTICFFLIGFTNFTIANIRIGIIYFMLLGLFYAEIGVNREPVNTLSGGQNV